MRTTSLPVAFAALALVAGCGGSGDQAQPTTVSVMIPSETTSTTSSTVTGEPTTITDEVAAGDEQAPQPESGSGASSAAQAAAAVLTTSGTVEQACGSFVTENFIETAYGGEENCIAARGHEALARAIIIGPGATNQSTHIVVVPKGGPYDGARVEVELVESDGGFRVDALDAHVPAGP